jgi:hypothetical protein
MKTKCVKGNCDTEDYFRKCSLGIYGHGEMKGNNQRIASLYEEAGINKSINNFRFISCETGEVGKRE